MTKFLMLLMLLLGSFAVTGCKAEGEVDADDGEVKIDVDKK